MINKIGLVVLRIIFVYFLGLNAVAFGAPAAAGDNAPRGARDGVLNVADLVVMERFVLGLETPTAEEFKVANVAPVGTLDNVLNVADLLVLQRAVLGLVTLPSVNLGPAAPVLNANTCSVNANPCAISGTAVANSTVHIYVNGVEQLTATANTSGVFTASIALLDGNNSVYAITQVSSDYSPASNTLTVNYVNNIPRTQGGSITQNTVWTPGASNAPYLITSNLTISTGVTLTIMPGAVLQFSANAYLYARGLSLSEGNLIVRGTPASKVVFTSAVHTAGTWSGIDIGAGSLIDNADIKYATSGVNARGGTVTNSILRNNTNGILVEKGTPQIGPGNVITTNVNGVYAKGLNFFDTDPNAFPHPIVTGNQIYNNTGYNYRADYFNNASTVVLNATNNWWGTASVDAIDKTTLSYTNTPFLSCTTTCFKTSPLIDFGGYLAGPGGVPVNANHLFGTIPVSITLDSNTIYELINTVVVPSAVTLTVPAGVTFDSRSISSKLTAEGTLIVQGTSNTPVIFTSTQTQATSYRWGGVRVSGLGTARINYAVFSYAQYGVVFDGTVADSGNCLTQCVQNSQFISNYEGIGLGNTVTILNNTFQSNSERGIRVYSGSAQIKANTFQSNGRGIYLLNSASPIINEGNVLTANPYGIYVETSAGDSQPVINNNRIYANTTYNYYARSPSSKVLNARNNWWGSAVLETIASKIYDYKDYAYSPVVDFSGYLQSPGGAPTVENNLAAITTDTTLYSNQTYRVMSSLRIATTATLTVQPGAILQFPANTKLLVDGSLVVQEGTRPAIFTSTARTLNSWNGIEVSSTATKVVIAGAVIQYADKGVYFNGATLQDLTCNVFCVKNSVIQYNNYGLYLTGAAKPMLTGNRIVNNSIWGIYLAGSGNDATSPNPVMTNNDIYKNYYYVGTYYNANGLYIYNYSSTTGIHINATGNWWGRAPTQSYGTSTASGSDIVISSTTTPLSVANYSSAATQSLFTAVSPPIVTLATSGAPFNAPATVTLNANATVTTGSISSVDFYNGTTWLGNVTSPVGNVYSFAWSNVAIGTYTLTARAANNIGLATTSTPVAVTVLGDVAPTISLTAPANGSVFYAPAMVPLGASVSTVNSSRTITKVGFYNGAILLGESTTSPYGYAWSNVTAGAYSITAVATDNTGATTVSAPVTITVNPVTLSIDSSINNSIVNDDYMLVTGSFIAPPNTGVTVNGVLATLFKNSDGSYTYYANNVPLNIGINTLTVSLVSQDGQTATTHAIVTSTGSPGFRIRADRVFDIQPNGLINFEYQNTSGRTVSAIQVDSNGDGTVDSTLAVSSNTLLFTINYSGYSTARTWPAIFKVLDAGNTVLYITTQAIVINTQAAQDAFIKPVITGMFSLLKQGNKTAAMQALSGEARNTYGGVFDALMPYMATVSGELSNVEAVSNGSDIASHAILRAEDGVNKVYIINSLKDKDGVWRIDSM